MRQFYSRLLPFSSSNSNCDDPFYEGCTFTQSNRPTLSGTTTSFLSCTFSSLTSTDDGGAISCAGNQKQLCIKQCSFISCVSSSGFGGGIYAEDSSSFFVEKSVLIDCNSTEKRGGGIYFTSAISFPVVSDAMFISCFASNESGSVYRVNDGGGIYFTPSLSSTQLHYILRSCRFISCGSYNVVGGCQSYYDSAVLGCTGSLFSSCKSSNAGALGISLKQAEANFFVSFCFFNSNVGTSTPTDITINRYAGSFSKSPIIQSLSTKSKDNSIRTCINWDDYQSPNWLPHARNFLYDVKISTSEALKFLTHLSIVGRMHNRMIIICLILRQTVFLMLSFYLVHYPINPFYFF